MGRHASLRPGVVVRENGYVCGQSQIIGTIAIEGYARFIDVTLTSRCTIR